MKEWEGGRARLSDDEYSRQESSWDEFNKSLLMSIFDGGLFLEQYKKHSMAFQVLDVRHDPYAVLRSVMETIRDKISRLNSISGQVDLCAAPHVPILATPSAPQTTASERAIRLCKRFPIAVRTLRRRHAGRATLDIQDEYDVQDLIHALLRVEFDDVRPEVVTPSYVGKSSRMDFLLKRECIVLEVKMTRDGLGTKELGDQLIIDIDRYRQHSDCQTLICFVYDPEHRVSNPHELEDDLPRDRGSMRIQIVVAPRD